MDSGHIPIKEQKPPWKFIDTKTGEEYPIWEKLPEQEAISFSNLVKKEWNLYNDQQKLLKEKTMDQLAQDEEWQQLYKEGEELNKEMQKIGSLILRRCYRMTTEQIGQMKYSTIKVLLFQVLQLSLGKAKIDFRY